jgi:pSer/pThr/pTyr-binding forkhead associated (FHA) protein
MGSEISQRLDKVKSTLNREILGDVPAVIVLGGSDDGRVFLLKNDTVSIGRIDSENRAAYRPGEDIVLSESYSAVTRVSRPHGRIVRDNDAWYIEDCGSTGGTQLNTKRLEKNVRTPLQDGDLIELAKGVSGVRLLAILPRDH